MQQVPLAKIGAAVTAQRQLFHNAVSSHFLKHCPAAHTLHTHPGAHTELADAVNWLLANSDRNGNFNDYTEAVLAQLGREHRRSDTNPAHYPLFADALAAGLVAIGESVNGENGAHSKHSDQSENGAHSASATDEASLRIDTASLNAAIAACAHACRIMATAAYEADAAHTPAYYTATIVDIERRCRGIEVVRLQVDTTLSYPLGEAVAIAAELSPGHWRMLHSAIPPNEYGQLEFHISNPETLLPIRPQLGDHWRIAPPMPTAQEFDFANGKDVLMLAAGTGLAPLRAILSHLSMQSNPPRVHLFFGADYPGQLYDLLTLWHLAGAMPTLSVIPVAAHATDEWWVGATEHSQPPRGLHLMQQGTIGEIASSMGTWADRDILIAGTPTDCADIRAALLRGGTPASAMRTIELDHRLG